MITKGIGVALSLALSVSGCVVRYTAPPPPPPLPPTPPPTAYPSPSAPPAPTAPPAPSAYRSECGSPILNLNSVARPGSMILFGDLPGTEEIPQFIGEAACQAAFSGVPVVIGLELPHDEQPALEAFLVSPGHEENRSRLLERPFWRRAQQDGRSSAAVLELIEYVRELKRNGRTVTLFAYDEPLAQAAEREAALARNISAWREHTTNALFLILHAGALVHSAQPRSREESMPMAAHLQRSEKRLVGLAPAYEGGMAWNCQGPQPDKIECCAHPVRGTYSPPGPPPSYLPRPSNSVAVHQRFISLWPRPSPDGFHGIFYVGRVTAAPPATQARRNGAKEWTQAFRAPSESAAWMNGESSDGRK